MRVHLKFGHDFSYEDDVMVRIPMICALLLLANGVAHGQDSHWSEMQMRGAHAAALAIVAANKCPSLRLNEAKASNFLSLVDLDMSSELVVQAVKEQYNDFKNMSQDQKTAKCIEAFDKFGPQMANFLARDQ